MSAISADADTVARVLESADAAFDRVMIGVASGPDLLPPALEPADAVRWAGDRVTELLAGLAELPLERMLGLVDPSGDHAADQADGSAGTNGTAPVAGEPVSVRAARGSLAEGRIWVHLIGDVPPGTLRFSLTDLVAGTAEPLLGGGARFEPSELTLPAPVGASTVLRLRVPAEATPGSYHGLVIGHGASAAVVPITVVIT